MTDIDRSPVRLRAPAGKKKLAYGPTGDFFFGVDADGHLNAPRFAVTDLIAAGCTRVDGKSEIIDVQAEVKAASAADLNAFLMSRGSDGMIVNRVETTVKEVRGADGEVIRDADDQPVTERRTQMKTVLRSLEDMKSDALTAIAAEAEIAPDVSVSSAPQDATVIK